MLGAVSGKEASEVAGESDVAGADAFAVIDKLYEHTHIDAPANLTSLRDAAIRFTDVIDRADIYDYVMSYIKGELQ